MDSVSWRDRDAATCSYRDEWLLGEPFVQRLALKPCSSAIAFGRKTCK